MSLIEVQRDVVELMRLVGKNRFLTPQDTCPRELRTMQFLISRVRGHPSELDTKCEDR